MIRERLCDDDDMGEVFVLAAVHPTQTHGPSLRQKLHGQGGKAKGKAGENMWRMLRRYSRTGRTSETERS